MLPDNLLVDGATNDLGPEYAERLQRTRRYLRRHPLLPSCDTIAAPFCCAWRMEQKEADTVPSPLCV